MSAFFASDASTEETLGAEHAHQGKGQTGSGKCGLLADDLVRSVNVCGDIRGSVTHILTQAWLTGTYEDTMQAQWIQQMHAALLSEKALPG